MRQPATPFHRMADDFPAHSAATETEVEAGDVTADGTADVAAAEKESREPAARRLTVQ